MGKGLLLAGIQRQRFHAVALRVDLLNRVQYREGALNDLVFDRIPAQNTDIGEIVALPRRDAHG